MWVHLYMCGYVEKYHMCGLKVGVCIISGYLRLIQNEPMGLVYSQTGADATSNPDMYVSSLFSCRTLPPRGGLGLGVNHVIT